VSTVLLAEDATELARLINRELQKARYRVLNTSGGESALDLYARHRPDLVIID
jgi:DNA-binding response OmpR family regulator